MMTDVATKNFARVRLHVSGVSPLVLAAYRDLRKCGCTRHDANLIAAGAAIASGQGIVEVKRVVRP
jgi:hypothetical protein